MSFFGHLGVSLSPREADEVFSVYLDFYERGWRPFPDVLPALDALGRTKKGVITNGDPGQQRAKLKAMGLAERFGVSVFSGEAGVSKPSDLRRGLRESGPSTVLLRVRGR